MSTTSSNDFNFKETRLERIPISKIRENADALRVTVNKEDADYQMNLDSVKKRGVMLPILVREIKDPVSGDILFGLVDGLHRLNWSMDAGYTDIPAAIGSLAEADLLEAQIIANVAKIETKPIQYTKALLRILGANPLMTITELGSRLSRDAVWVNNRLGLLKLTPDIQKLVDDDTLKLVNAYALSKLPEDKQAELLQQAISQPAQQFCPMADNIRKELATARREGRKAEVDTFKPNPRLQKLSLIKDEQAFSETQPHNSTLLAAAKRHGVASVEGAIAFAMKWVLHLDPDSLAKDESDWKADKATEAAKKAEAAKKKEAEKQAKAQAALSPVGPLQAVQAPVLAGV